MFNLEALFLMEYSSVNKWLNLCLWIQSPACILALVFVLITWYCFRCTVKCNMECAPSTLLSVLEFTFYAFFFYTERKTLHLSLKKF